MASPMKHDSCRVVELLFSPVQVMFVQIDTDDDSSDRVSEFFGIEDGDTPTCRLINLEGDMKKFVPDFSGLNPDDIRKFVGDFLSGELKAGPVGVVGTCVMWCMSLLHALTCGLILS